jgi:hypothetical protein
MSHQLAEAGIVLKLVISVSIKSFNKYLLLSTHSMPGSTRSAEDMKAHKADNRAYIMVGEK